jgi:poly-gamma-glutamate synthesis protein (capsule biosynthesis protein)
MPGIASIVKGASLGLVTLEQNLLLKDQPAQSPGSYQWPHGDEREAKVLRNFGFAVVSLANNHAEDYGVEGLRRTDEILRRNGLMPVGAGDDLQTAGSAAYIGEAPRRVAVIAVTTSTPSEARATSSQGEIMGRPGVNVLRYSPLVTIDEATFKTLKNSGIIKNVATKGAPEEWAISGTPIHKGAKTVVQFEADKNGEERIFEQIKIARSKTQIVILMLHSHEPSDESDWPAEFVQQFAEAAIDAGASTVIGDGPHRLRGIETYKGALIFYSLGNFVFQDRSVNPDSFDLYDRGLDLFQFSLGASNNPVTSPASSHREERLESMIAITRFVRGTLASAEIRPVYLGSESPPEDQGVPHLATVDQGKATLERLSELSHGFGTTIQVVNGRGRIDLSARGTD